MSGVLLPLESNFLVPGGTFLVVLLLVLLVIVVPIVVVIALLLARPTGVRKADAPGDRSSPTQR
jgi:hypothetical protein